MTYLRLRRADKTPVKREPLPPRQQNGTSPAVPKTTPKPHPR